MNWRITEIAHPLILRSWDNLVLVVPSFSSSFSTATFLVRPPSWIVSWTESTSAINLTRSPSLVARGLAGCDVISSLMS